MFLTKAGCELPFPGDVFGDDVKRWQAMTIPVGLPWFLAVTKFVVKRRSFIQTTAFALEWSVISLVESSPPKAVLAMHYVAPCKQGHGWTMSRIAELWRPGSDERMETGALLMRFEGGASLYDYYGGEVSTPNPSRTRLLCIEP